MEKRTVVLKFGGASVAKPEMFNHVAALIQEHKQYYSRIVTVVSAMGGMTNALSALAQQVHPSPPSREYDMLVSVGERISIALLAMALAKRNIEAVSFTGSQSGIITCPKHSDARIVAVHPERILASLEREQIAIVAGFQGVCNKEITTLGRGGSDTTAVALAVALGADKVVYYKDVPGIFSADPKAFADAIHLPNLLYDAAIDVVSKSESAILHPRCLRLAKDNGVPLEILSYKKQDKGTWVHGGVTKSRGEPIYEERVHE